MTPTITWHVSLRDTANFSDIQKKRVNQHLTVNLARARTRVCLVAAARETASALRT